jgi:hypothetical protein
MSNLSISDLEVKLREARAAVTELEQTLKAASPDKQLAEELHNIQCHWNHTDGCDWYYEISDNIVNWDGQAHGEYLKRARRMICACEAEGIDPKVVVSLFKILR